ncbi:MAG TPA: PAS-domain containing protein [Stellaceae bacterium]|nr:PAS-domain containing protein [Stellaceae bacterium]
MAFTEHARRAAASLSLRIRRFGRRTGVAGALRRAKAEAEAARLEADRLRRLVEEANRHLLEAQRIGKFGHWIADEVAKTVIWSPQMFEITGLPPQPVMALDLSRLPPLHPDDRAIFFDVRERTIATGETLMAEVRFVRPDGGIRWVHVEMRAHYDEAGRFVRMFGTTQDITERRRTEEDLNAAREQLIDAIEAISEGFALFDRDERFVLTNSNYVRMFPPLGETIAPGTPYRVILEAGIAKGRAELEGEDPETVIRRKLEEFRACAESREVRFSGDRWIRMVERRTRDGGIVAIRADITEKKRAEEALKAAQLQLIDAIESMSDGFALFDRDDRYVLTNTNYRRLYVDQADLFAPGTRYEDTMRLSAERGLQDLGGESLEDWVGRRIAWHQACAEPIERRLPDGRWVRAVERRTSDGGIVAIRTDITKRKQAEEALQAAQEQLADAVESISEGFVLFDAEDRYVLTNSNYRRLYPGIEDLCTPGRTFESAMRANLGRNLHEFGPAGGEVWLRNIMEWHRACDQPMEQQLTDGRWVRAVERRTRNGGIAGIRTDITAIKEAEAALMRKVRDLETAQERLEKLSRDLTAMTGDLAAARDAAEGKAAELARNEARFRDFALTSSHWLWETDEQHRFCYVSEGVRAFGFTTGPGSLLGRTRLEIAVDAGTDAEKWRQHHALLDRHEPFRDFVFTWKNPAGAEGVACVSGDPVFDAAGRFLGYRGTGRDITEQVFAESALREAKQAAEAASLAKSQFLANMSHELRTPLNAILGFSEMIALALKGPVPADYQEYAGHIHESGRHLHEVINDILDLAKVDAGKFELRAEKGVDPRRTVEACVTLVRGHAEAAGVRLATEIGDDLPVLVADPTRLKQILLNLLSNAVKFTGPGGSVAIAVGRLEEGGVAFEVRDTGLGMTAAEIEIALEPFGQIDAGYTRKQEGTGLGLPLARRLAELHGGSLRIDSEKGRGTTVTVRLPASPPAAPNEAFAMLRDAAG